MLCSARASVWWKLKSFAWCLCGVGGKYYLLARFGVCIVCGTLRVVKVMADAWLEACYDATHELQGRCDAGESGKSRMRPTITFTPHCRSSLWPNDSYFLVTR